MANLHFHTWDPQRSYPFWDLKRFLTDVVGKSRLRSKDKTTEEVGTNDKRVFIKSKGLPSDYKDTQNFLKAAL